MGWPVAISDREEKGQRDDVIVDASTTTFAGYVRIGDFRLIVTIILIRHKRDMGLQEPIMTELISFVGDGVRKPNVM